MKTILNSQHILDFFDANKMLEYLNGPFKDSASEKLLKIRNEAQAVYDVTSNYILRSYVDLLIDYGPKAGLDPMDPIEYKQAREAAHTILDFQDHRGEDDRISTEDFERNLQHLRKMMEDTQQRHSFLLNKFGRAMDVHEVQKLVETEARNLEYDENELLRVFIAGLESGTGMPEHMFIRTTIVGIFERRERNFK